MSTEPLLSVAGLTKHFPVKRGIVFQSAVGTVRAVDGVSFELTQGRTLGIVGESGSGKSTTLHQILGLHAPQGGSIEVLGADVAALDRRARRHAILRPDLPRPGRTQPRRRREPGRPQRAG